MSNLLDTEFFNSLNDDASKDAFHLLRKKMFEVKAKAEKAKTDAETVRAEEVKAKAEKAKTKAEEQEEARQEFFSKYGKEFTTESLTWAGKVKEAAQAVNLRFSSYVDNEVNKNGKFVRTVIKCVISVPKR